MSRRPYASAINEASGAYKKDPQRRNKSEPKPKRGWPEAPQIISEDTVAFECWNRVCNILDDMNILTKADSELLAMYCIDYSMFMALYDRVKGGNVSAVTTHGTVMSSPDIIQMQKFSDRLLKRQTELGLTPSSRVKLHAPTEEKEDGFSEWLKMQSDN